MRRQRAVVEAKDAEIGVLRGEPCVLTLSPPLRPGGTS